MLDYNVIGLSRDDVEATAEVESINRESTLRNEAVFGVEREPLTLDTMFQEDMPTQAQLDSEEFAGFLDEIPDASGLDGALETIAMTAPIDATDYDVEIAIEDYMIKSFGLSALLGDDLDIPTLLRDLEDRDTSVPNSDNDEDITGFNMVTKRKNDVLDKIEASLTEFFSPMRKQLEFDSSMDKNAVKKLQTRIGTKVDGIWGPNSQKALDMYNGVELEDTAAKLDVSNTEVAIPNPTGHTLNEKNNNIGNLKRTKDKWQGMTNHGSTETFVKFDTPQKGVRATAIVMRKHLKRASSYEEYVNNYASEPTEQEYFKKNGKLMTHLQNYAKKLMSSQGATDIKSKPSKVNLREWIKATAVAEGHSKSLTYFTDTIIDEGLK